MTHLISSHGFPTPIGAATVMGTVLANIAIAKHPLKWEALIDLVMNELDLADEFGGAQLIVENVLFLVEQGFVISDRAFRRVEELSIWSETVFQPSEAIVCFVRNVTATGPAKSFEAFAEGRG